MANFVFNKCCMIVLIPVFSFDTKVLELYEAVTIAALPLHC